MAGKKDDDQMEKLVKLTKMMKSENIKVAPKGISRGHNKWKSSEPKFPEKTEKPAHTVKAGGMDVDPARQQEYENWRKDKEEEERYRREQAAKRAAAEAQAREAARKLDY